MSVRGGQGCDTERTSCVQSAGLVALTQTEEARPGQARHRTTPALVVNKNRWKNAINFNTSTESGAGWVAEV